MYIAMSDLDNKSFIQFIYDLNVIRVYYIEKFGSRLFFLSDINMDGVTPFASHRAVDIHKRIVESLNNKNRIEMEVFYNVNTTPKKKQKQIQKLVGIDGNYDKKIMKALLILMTI
jgi:hypothetical protein